MSLKATLKKLDFKDKEIVLYTTLLKCGRLSPTELVKQTRINRATVYNIAQSLQSKGIISEDLSGKTLFYTPLPPNTLLEVVEKPIRELEPEETLPHRQQNKQASLLPRKATPVPSIRFVEEHELQGFYFAHVSKWIKSVRSINSTW